jgi:hypothetical protein
MSNEPINAQASVHTEDDLRQIERARLQSLVERNMPLAQQLHAADFELITPIGSSYSKERYLDEVASGALRYLRWEPEDIAVRMHERMALLRYRASLEVDSVGGRPSLLRCWHLDSYELRGGLWQVVWSQATAIRPPQ